MAGSARWRVARGRILSGVRRRNLARRNFLPNSPIRPSQRARTTGHFWPEFKRRAGAARDAALLYSAATRVRGRLSWATTGGLSPGRWGHGGERSLPHPWGSKGSMEVPLCGDANSHLFARDETAIRFIACRGSMPKRAPRPVGCNGSAQRAPLPTIVLYYRTHRCGRCGKSKIPRNLLGKPGSSRAHP
jgi:hypothetical protein